MHQYFEKISVQSINKAYVFNGSIGLVGHDFRYRLEQDGKERIIHAATYSKLCYEKADDIEKQDFTWDEAGVASMRDWLRSQYERFLERDTEAAK